MKITLELLQKIKACQTAINKFYNTKELHEIDIHNITSIVVTDNCLFNDISWLQEKLKNHFKLKTLTYKSSSGYTEEYTYDERGNCLTFKSSSGNTYEYTYDERGNCLTTKSSSGYTEEYTYDENYDLTGFEYQ